MSKFIILSTAAAFFGSVIAGTATPSDYLEITDLDLTTFTNSTSTWSIINDTISFTVQNPVTAPALASHSTCSGSWPATGQVPTSYVKCGPAVAQNGSDASHDSFWEFKFGDDAASIPVWEGPEKFGLTVSNIYTDPTVGAPPYDQRQSFASGEINSEQVDCSTSKLGGSDLTITKCALKKDATVQLKIYSEA